MNEIVHSADRLAVLLEEQAACIKRILEILDN